MIKADELNYNYVYLESTVVSYVSFTLYNIVVGLCLR